MSAQAWTFAGLVVTSLAGIIAAIAGLVASSRSKDARDYSAPTGNGYADESRAAWRKLEDQMLTGFAALREEMRAQFERAHDDHADLAERHVRTNTTIVRHLQDHASHDINRDA